ncbi:hypothetical protein ACFX2G_028674 [Malus domestica]
MTSTTSVAILGRSEVSISLLFSGPPSLYPQRSRSSHLLSIFLSEGVRLQFHRVRRRKTMPMEGYGGSLRTPATEKVGNGVAV